MSRTDEAILRLKIAALLALAAKQHWPVMPAEAERMVAREGLTEAARMLAQRPTNPLARLYYRGRELFRRG